MPLSWSFSISLSLQLLRRFLAGSAVEVSQTCRRECRDLALVRRSHWRYGRVVLEAESGI